VGAGFHRWVAQSGVAGAPDAVLAAGPAAVTQFEVGELTARRIVCTTNSIESVNARIRKAVRSRGHFPTEQAALKCVYMAVMSLDPTGTGRKRWTIRWEGAMNAFDLAFDGRLTAGQLWPHQPQLHL